MLLDWFQFGKGGTSAAEAGAENAPPKTKLKIKFSSKLRGALLQRPL
jgi:hypothetical protein